MADFNAMTASMPYVDGALFLMTQIDLADSTTSYYGYAVPGTADATAKWMITRIKVVGTVQTKAFAGGTLKFNKAWTGRAGFSYS